MQQLKDTAIILSRVDYAERDRILILLCAEHGKISALAKGVRSEKSRLAGGIELLSESEVSLITSRRSNIYTLTSARLKNHYGSIVQDIRRMQHVFLLLKTVYDIADEGAGQEYFPVLVQVLRSFDEGKADPRLIDIWFNLQALKLSGSEPNLSVDSSEDRFEFDYESQSFQPHPEGSVKPNDLKLLRLCLTGNKPPIVQNSLGSEDRLQTLTRTLLKLNVTEV
jgi:DNA repair protein RecO (recombination protein O)